MDFHEQNKWPKSLVFKKYGGNERGTVFEDKVVINSPLVQSLVFYEQSKRGWGPKLFGLFENGRVEELVDGHTLTAEEAFTPDMIKDSAKAFARFNSHKFPFCQKPRDILQEAMLTVEPSKNDLRELINSGDLGGLKEANYPMEEMLNFPYETERQWIDSIESKITQRVVFCTLDNNYLNRLVRNVKQSDENSTMTVLIDFDQSAYSYRGTELAGHFLCRLFDISSKDSKYNNVPIPTESERTEFLIAYLEECKELFDDFDADSLDSLEQLTLEVDFHLCSYALSCVIFCIQVVKLIQPDASMGAFVRPMLKIQKELKEYFCKKYPSLVN